MYRSNLQRKGLSGPILTSLQLTPQLLKPAVAEALVELMAPIITAFEASKEWQEITLKAYPPPEKKKKEKKQKDKGNRYPGAKTAETAELPLREIGVQEPTAD